MRKIVVLACIALLAVSCGKSFLEPGGDSFIPGEPMLTQIKQGSAVRTKFDYNNFGQLVKITMYHSNGVVSGDEVRRYDDQGYLIKIERSSDISSSMSGQYIQSYSEPVYDAGKKIVELKNYNMQSGASSYVSRTALEYDTQGRVVSETIYAMPANTAASKNVYEYNAENNVTKATYYQFSLGTSATGSRTYEYDSKKNPLRGKWVMPYGVNPSNIVKEVYTNHIVAPGVSNTPVTSIINFKSYSASGYPTLVNEAGLDYSYEYQ